MKLVKIFSDKNFKNVKFNEHFNVVLATIQDKTNKTDTHNLGKTSLIHVIDFLLLGRFTADHFLFNSIFSDQTFYLEIKLNSGKYLVIKRGVNTASKISFKQNDFELNDFIAPVVWDETELTFDKAKEKLKDYLNFDVLTNWSYRQSITYFLRTQQDYSYVFKLNKFKGKHSDWKPFVFDALGFNADIIKHKADLEQKAKKIKDTIDILKQDANIDITEKDKLLSLLDIKQREKIIAEKTIDKFNFFLQDKNISKEIIEQLDFKIQTLHTDRYRVNYEISKIEESIRNAKNTINVQKLKTLFDEVNLYFPDKLKKQYDELEKFNRSISEERNKFLKENLKKLEKELYSIDTELVELENAKSEKLSFLTEKDTYTKFKTYQKQLSILESDIDRLNEKLELLDKTALYNKELKVIGDQMQKTIQTIQETIGKRNHADINKIFNELLKDIVGTDAIISIKQNTKGNIDFTAEYIDFIDKNSTSESEGTSYKKLLCMAFDIALLIYYSQKSFFRFVYHDGIIEGLDNRIKIRLLNRMKSICKQYNIQYIISLIDSDIPTQNDGSLYSFNPDEICLELNDLNDDGKLFMQSF
ncbi:MAG: DUF2326 domain-containing protein [Planctomycetaceae bacterium]|jgi:uncharacterized protein YydD (DUF2326 family)|nr:DUF2326 domain-containing protein [Planctomycetaceae bacterium]